MPNHKTANRYDYAYSAAEACRDILASVSSPNDVRNLDIEAIRMVQRRGAALVEHLEGLARAYEAEQAHELRRQPFLPLRAVAEGKCGPIERPVHRRRPRAGGV